MNTLRFFKNELYLDKGVCFKVSISLRLANFNKVDKKYFMPYLMKKVRILKSLIENFSQKNFIQTIQQRPSISKLCQILAKIIENVKKNCRVFTQLLTSITPCKTEFEIFLIPYSRMYVLFNDTTHNSLR